MPSIQTTPFEVKDFKGGMTDFYIGAEPNRYQTADNFIIEKHGDIGKLVQRPGSEVFTYTDAGGGAAIVDQIPAGAQRIGALFYSVTNGGTSMNSQRLKYISATHVYYMNQSGAAFEENTLPNGAALLTGATTSSSYSIAKFASDNAIVAWANTQQPVYVPRNTGATIVGLPKISGYTTTAGSVGTTFSYVYRVCYVSGDVRSAFTEVASTTNAAITAGAANTNTLNSLAAAASQYGSPSKEIYRTTNGGTTFYKVTTISSVTTSYADVMPDATLILQEPAYTEAGVVESHQPPTCSHVHVCGNRAYYGNTGTATTSRLFQSITGAPAYTPEDFYVDLAQAITGLSSVKDVPIVLCERGNVYRIDGVIDELGGGDMTPTILANDAACVSGMSVVQAGNAIYWAGAEGFYYCDGYNVMLISEGLRETYKTFTDTYEKRRRIVGTYHDGENRIYWTAQVGTASDCNMLFVLDLNWGVSRDMPFTTWSGGTNFAPTALAVVDIAYTNGQTTPTLSNSRLDLVRGDTRGYALRHKSTLLSDHKIDSSVGSGNALAQWGTTAIICTYTSAGTDFGVSSYRKWVPNMSAVFYNEGDLSVQINSINDDGRNTGSLKKIRFRDAVEYTGMIDEFRRFPATGLRCEFKQVQFTNAYVVITSSTATGVLCSVNGTTNIATIASGSWPTEALEYYISFSNDSYVTQYLITVRSASSLTFTDAGNVAPTGSGLGWVIRGYPRNEKMRLHSYAINYAAIGQTQTPFHSTTTGEP